MWKPVLATAALLVGLLPGVSSVAAAEAQVTGTVTYRERIALPPDAVLTVKLVDVSLQDVAATVLSQAQLAMTGVPASFALDYDADQIAPGHSYAVQARIERGDRLLFVSTSRYGVLTQGAGSHVDMVLQAAGSDRDQSSGGQVRLAGTDWTVTTLEGEALTLDRLPTISFGEDGALAIFGGCNRFVGQMQTNGDGFAIGDNLAGTMMACPEAVAAVESRLLDVLREVSRTRSNGSDLSLMNSDGTVLITASAGL